MVDISVVLPAYNEARSIAASLRSLATFLDAATSSRGPWSSWEVVLADDGSSDGTAEVARSALPGDARVRVLEPSGHLGKGAAVRRGVLEASGSLILVTDVDLSYGLADLTAAVTALRAGGADVVTGDRRHPGSRMDLALSALGHVVRRQAISYGFNLAVRLLFGLACRDTQCGLKGYRREAAARLVTRLRTNGFLADVEIFIIAERLGLKVATIPVHLTYLSGDSTVHVVRQAPRVLADALRIKAAQLKRRYDGDGAVGR